MDMASPEAVLRSRYMIGLAHQLQPAPGEEAAIVAHIPVPPTVIRTFHDKFKLFLRLTEFGKLVFNETAIDPVIDVSSALFSEHCEHRQRFIGHGLRHTGDRRGVCCKHDGRRQAIATHASARNWSDERHARKNVTDVCVEPHRTHFGARANLLRDRGSCVLPMRMWHMHPESGKRRIHEFVIRRQNPHRADCDIQYIYDRLSERLCHGAFL